MPALKHKIISCYTTIIVVVDKYFKKIILNIVGPTNVIRTCADRGSPDWRDNYIISCLRFEHFTSCCATGPAPFNLKALTDMSENARIRIVSK